VWIMDGPAQRPVVGAAMTVELLPAYQDWLFEHGGRDLELQDPVSHEVLDGDWGPLVRQIRSARCCRATTDGWASTGPTTACGWPPSTLSCGA